MRKALYGGTFGPPTNGHLWVIQEALKLFDHLVIAVAVNPEKKQVFAPEVVKRMLEEMTDGLPVSVVIVAHCYLVNYAKEVGATHLIRGVRNQTDFEYELGIRQINGDIDPSISNVYLIPPRELREISSSTVRGLVGAEGWERLVATYVPPAALIRLIAREHAWVWEVLKAAGAEGDPDLFWRDALLPYFGPERFYHAWTHIADGLNELRRVRASVLDLAAAVLALKYHDRFYDVTRKDNEERSAEACRACALSLTLSEAIANHSSDMVLATKGHQSSDPDTQTLIDIDLSILGYPPDAFTAYEAGVEQEYAPVYTKKERLIGRAGWVVNFLDEHKERIYYTDAFEERYGAQARRNLEDSLLRLERA